MKLKVLETFSGIGAQRRALENIASKENLDLKFVGTIDISIQANLAYLAIHHNDLVKTWKKEFNITTNSVKDKLIEKMLDEQEMSLGFGSISTKKQILKKLEPIKLFILAKAYKAKIIFFNIRNFPGNRITKRNKIDLLTYSFPCQSISNAGALHKAQNGFKKGSNTKSSLVWEIERILNEIKDKDIKSLPKFLLLENVSSINGSKFRPELEKWLKVLKSLGYTNHCFIFNARDVNWPQYRKRFFCISKLNNDKELDSKWLDKVIDQQNQLVNANFYKFNKNTELMGGGGIKV